MDLKSKLTTLSYNNYVIISDLELKELMNFGKAVDLRRIYDESKS